MKEIKQRQHNWMKERAANKGNEGITGSGCSKLMTLLVNEKLKFQTLISQILNIFSIKNISVFGYKVLKHT